MTHPGDDLGFGFFFLSDGCCPLWLQQSLISERCRRNKTCTQAPGEPHELLVSSTTQRKKRNGTVCILSVSQQQKCKLQEQCLFQTLNSWILNSVANHQGSAGIKGLISNVPQCKVHWKYKASNRLTFPACSRSIRFSQPPKSFPWFLASEFWGPAKEPLSELALMWGWLDSAGRQPPWEFPCLVMPDC